MRGAGHELITPRDLPEALTLLADGEARCFAGGTDLMVLMAAGRLGGRRFVNLWPLAELRGVRATPEALVLGALTSYREVQEHPLLRREFPMLCQAGSETGGPAIQNRGTLGGNIANASPAADSPPTLLCYQAELLLRSARGARRVAYADFHTGYKQTALQPGELIEALILPRRAAGAPRRHFYRKVGPRQAQAISKVCFAACAEGDTALRIALGGVAPTVVLCRQTAAELLRGRQAGDDAALTLARARAALRQEIAPIDDVRSTRRYRQQVAENLLGAWVAEWQGLTGSSIGAFL